MFTVFCSPIFILFTSYLKFKNKDLLRKVLGVIHDLDFVYVLLHIETHSQLKSRDVVNIKSNPLTALYHLNVGGMYK